MRWIRSTLMAGVLGALLPARATAQPPANEVSGPIAARYHWAACDAFVCDDLRLDVYPVSPVGTPPYAGWLSWTLTYLPAYFTAGPAPAAQGDYATQHVGIPGAQQYAGDWFDGFTATYGPPDPAAPTYTFQGWGGRMATTDAAGAGLLYLVTDLSGTSAASRYLPLPLVSDPSITPEPTSLALLGSGLVLVGGMARRRRPITR